MNREDDICWYHENLGRQKAEELLLKDGVIEGSFLVRRSGSSTGDYVLSVRNNNTIAHFQIRRHTEDAFFSIEENVKVHGLESLVEHYQEQPAGIDGVILTDPIKGDLPPHDSRRHGRTNLLHRATACGNDVVVVELLRTGYRHEAKNENGQTAVHLASMHGYNHILEHLIEYRANVNFRDTAAYTPLHYACHNNFVNTVRLLIQKGSANIQARNTENGWVPLHEAANAGHVEVVRELLLLGAPVKPRTKNKELPADLARINGHFDCVEVLEQYETPAPRTTKLKWYHGTLDRHEAETYVLSFSKENGTYLVRYSTRNKETVLTLYNEGSFFNYIVKKQENYYFIDDGPLLDSLEHVIEYYSFISDGLPTILTIPVPPKPKPPVPECKTIPRQKKKLTASVESATETPVGCHSDFVPSHFDIKFSTNLTRSELSLNNNTRPAVEKPGEQHEELTEYIPKESLQLISILGNGEFGSVWKGKYLQKDGVEVDVAVKSLHNEQLETNRESFLREAEVMMQLDHPCIVKLIGLTLGPPLQMVQELMELDCMLYYIVTHADQIDPEREFIIWAGQIACGMQYLEEQRFVHRDLAARNILLASTVQAKISDFGLSRALGTDHEYYRAKKGGKWPIKWYAPESYIFGKFSHKSDVWSYGVTIWEMYSFGQHPYGELKGPEVMSAVNGGTRLAKPERCPNRIYNEMQSCWECNADKRPTFKELYEFFKNDTCYTNIKEMI